MILEVNLGLASRTILFTDFSTNVHQNGFQGDLPEAKREKGAKLLESTKPHVESALIHMKEAHKLWT